MPRGILLRPEAPEREGWEGEYIQNFIPSSLPLVRGLENMTCLSFDNAQFSYVKLSSSSGREILWVRGS